MVYAKAFTPYRVIAVSTAGQQPGSVTWTQDLPDFPGGLAEAVRHVFVSLPRTETVLVLDKATGRQVTRIPVPGAR
ncbi:hypothetical protein [Kibdelosporangium aridum]|uniref:Uncharacterized protein n=1 Tax=Kibdelosporangium aridum TaxID=2030 RepID=A0A1W2AZU8_KIBAR|nr:hypothetical protein [Kibdelosporangium aridum]SMC65708.1 hypothetical protein SAMN05661093_01199 [Kibdelosporangium aridum]